MRRGLTFGKYMPLHRGHQLLIDVALSRCDDLTIIIYDSKPGVADQYRMPLQKRLGWIRDLYPTVENLLGFADPFPGGGEGPDKAQVYADQISFLGEFDYVFTSEPEYEEFARLLGAKHILVDESRTLVPTSGTEIRSDIYEYRGWMDPLVYTSLIQKVVFVGTESTGKTTLAKAMAAELDTMRVHEFGRELWEAQDLKGSFADHLKMGRRQYQREQAAARQARDFLFCDTNAWTTLQWSLMSYGTADQRLYDLANRTIDDYHWIFCANDFDWVQDGTRELAGKRAQEFQDQQLDDLNQRGVHYQMVTGSLYERIERMKDYLNIERRLGDVRLHDVR